MPRAKKKLSPRALLAIRRANMARARAARAAKLATATIPGFNEYLVDPSFTPASQAVRHRAVADAYDALYIAIANLAIKDTTP